MGLTSSSYCQAKLKSIVQPKPLENTEPNIYRGGPRLERFGHLLRDIGWVRVRAKENPQASLLRISPSTLTGTRLCMYRLSWPALQTDLKSLTAAHITVYRVVAGRA